VIDAGHGLRHARLGDQGFPWRNAHLDGDQPKVDVTVRADRWNTLGHPKSDASDRSIPLAPRAVRALKAWREAAPEGRTLAFGTASDKPVALNNLTRRLLKPLETKAGIPHFGWHGLRHYAISTWMKICRGDFEKVRAWAGHQDLTLTLSTYSHLLEDGEAHARMADAEALLSA
jgi:integrase